MPLALWDGIGSDGDAAMRVDGDGGRGERAVLEPAGKAVLMLQNRGDVAHVGDGRLHRRRHPDAVKPPLGAGCRAAGPELVDGRPGEVDDRVEIAGIVKRAGCRPVRHRLHEVTPQHLQPVEAQPVGDAVHQPLQREIDLRAAETPIEAARRLVGDGDAVLDFEVRDVVGPGHRAVHPVERRRLRRLDVGAAVLELPVAERRHPPVGHDGGLQPGFAVGGGAGGGQVFQPVLDPFHRPAGKPGDRGHQHDIGREPLLDAEAAAGVGRGAQAQPVGRHAQGRRHHRMQRERPLEGRRHLIGAGVGVPGGDQPETLDGRHRAARIAHLDGEAAVGGGEGAFRVAVGKAPPVREIGAGGLVQQRRTFRYRRRGRDDGGKRLVLDLHQLQRILGPVAVLRQHDRDRLARIAHLVGRDREVAHGRAQRRDEGPEAGGDVRPREQAHALRRGDGAEPRMGVGRAQDRGMERARRHGQVVDEPPPAAEQRRVLHPLAACHAAFRPVIAVPV